jgi:transcription elongation factor S-II
MSQIQSVLNLKEVLEKELLASKTNHSAAASSSSSSCPSIDERCSDVLEQLRNISMTYVILNETMIGVTVNKFKSHPSLGPIAKALIKSWKQTVTKTTQQQQQPAGAAAAAAAASAVTISAANSTTTEADRKTNRRESLDSIRSNGSRSGHLVDGNVDNDNDDDDDSNTKSNYDPTTEWEGLSQQRQTLCQKIYTIFTSVQSLLVKEYGVNERAMINLFGPRTVEIEHAIHTKYMSTTKKEDRKGYADKARSLIFNLSKNKSLTVSIVLGHVAPDELISYTTEQLASDEIRIQRERTAQRLIESRRLDWNEANEDKINNMCGIKGDLLNASLFTCGRCKSIKTTSTQKQTRSADEPMTVFVLCLSCGKRWKC